MKLMVGSFEKNVFFDLSGGGRDKAMPCLYTSPCIYPDES